MGEFDKTFFDEEFYRSKIHDKNGIGIKGAKRDQNNPFYKEFSGKVNRILGGQVKTILDIGGGMGIRTKNYIDLGFDAYCCDVSEWAYQNSEIGKDKHYCCDVREIDMKVPGVYDLVVTERILGYVPETGTDKALENIYNKCTKYAIFSIICSDHKDQERPIQGAPGRINMKPRTYWLEKLNSFNWKINEEKTKVMLENGWDCIWVFEK
jgi:hypothetical protein